MFVVGNRGVLHIHFVVKDAKKASGMQRVVAIIAIVEPLLWVYFLLANMTSVLFRGAARRRICQDQGMFVMPVPDGPR